MDNHQNALSLGCSIFRDFGCYIVLISDLTINGDSPSKIKMIAVFECGLVIETDQTSAQIKDGISISLTTAFLSNVTLAWYGVTQDNLHNYPLPKESTPEPINSIIDINDSPGGLDEAPAPPSTPLKNIS